MPRPNKNPMDKAKDFKGAVKRLLKELKSFKILIAIALSLATLGSILSILIPNILSDLTDEISGGLAINQGNFEEIVTNVTSSFSEDKMASLMTFELSKKNVDSILKNKKISSKDKKNFNLFIEALTKQEQDNVKKYLYKLPKDILEKIVTEDGEFSKEDKINLILAKGDIPLNMYGLFLEPFDIDGVYISVEDQAKFMSLVGGLEDLKEADAFYKVVDQMPDSIKKVIEPSMNMDKITKITLTIGAMLIASSLFTYIQSIAMTHTSNNFARKLRSGISTKINKLPLKYFDNYSIGDTLSRVTNDVDMIAQSMNQSLATLVSSITLFIGTTIMMFVTNGIMALTAIISSLFGFIFMFFVLGRSQKYFVARQKELGNLNGHIEEIYSGLNVVKTYNAKNKSDKEFDELNDRLYEASWRSHSLGGLMQPMMGFIGNIGYVAVCIVGALLVLNNHISFGVIVAFTTYVRLFTSPLSQIAQSMNSVQQIAASSERVFEFIDEPEMADERKFEKHLEREDVKGKIEFKNVEFTYDGNDTPTIKNFSAVAKPGEKIAIVGPTGAGKTTMVNLLMKFYEINSGDIKIDDVSTKELTRDNIHNLFTMVLQDTWLFDGTVKENIIYNRKNVSDEDVRRVCKTVGLDHFIKTLPKGYDTVLSDNNSVSAGQRQLLTIARGMIEDSPFLILDEATSNVDTRTEELVQKAMDKLTEGKTSFIIAHRLSTIKNADLILVMQDGNIVEQGNHEELMKKKGFYADIYNSQFEL